MYYQNYQKLLLSLVFTQCRQLAETSWFGAEETQDSSLPDAGVLAQKQPQAVVPLPVRSPECAPLHHRNAEERTWRSLVHGGQGLRPVSQPQLHFCYGELSSLLHLILNISCSDRRFCLTGADVEAVFDVASCHLGGEGLTFGPEHSTASDRGLRHLDLHHCAHWRSRHQLW